ncbi:MAG: glycosyltransferase [Muribaculaceae bacterium]|nr:glycosyltransferase [Muribaculaceae bacterium]
MLLSIILPIYNMEEYLTKCLDSILRQGLDDTEYEVILVNDGSTDSSQKICEEYIASHQNFRLINQKNGGVARARNTGINASTGKFIAFLDPDDYLLDNGLKIAFRKYADRDDIDVIHFYSSYDFWDVKPIIDEIEYEGTTHDNLALHKGGLPSFCWIYIYRKDFLDKHNIRFKPYRVGEDQLFISTVFIANARYLSCKADIYRYVVRESSASTNRRKKHAQQCVKDYLNAYSDIMTAMNVYKVDEKPEVYHACISSLNSKKNFGYSRMLTADYNYKDFKKIMQFGKEIGFLPLPSSSSNWKTSIISKIKNSTTTNYVLYKLVSGVFNHIFTPYIMPRLRVSFKR